MAVLPDINGISYTSSNLNWMAYTGAADGSAAAIGSVNPSAVIDVATLSATRSIIVTVNSSTSDPTAMLVDTSGVTAAIAGTALAIDSNNVNGVMVTALDSRYAMFLCYRPGNGRIYGGVLDTNGDTISLVGGSLIDLSTPVSANSGLQVDLDTLTSTTAIVAFRDVSASNRLSAMVLVADTGTGNITTGSAVDMSGAAAVRDVAYEVKVKAISATRFAAAFATTGNTLYLTCGTVSGTTVTAVDLEGVTGGANSASITVLNTLDTNTYLMASMIQANPTVGIGLLAAYTEGGGSSTLTNTGLVGVPGMQGTFLALDADSDYDYGVVVARAATGTGIVCGARVAHDTNMVELAKTKKSMGADSFGTTREQFCVTKVSTSKALIVYDSGTTIKAYIASR